LWSGLHLPLYLEAKKSPDFKYFRFNFAYDGRMHAGLIRLPDTLLRGGPQGDQGLVHRSAEREGEWRLDDLAGRLVEISGARSTAQLTAAFGLILEAQLCGDRAAWVTFEHSAFFPPDAAAGGVDVEALPVVRIANAPAAARAAEHLVRSGGFGVVVIDLSSGADAAASPALPVPMLTRLLGLARAHHAAVLILTRKSPEMPSLNSLISLRAEAQRMARDDGSSAHGSSAKAPGAGSYEVRVRVLKDKRRAPGWDHVETCRGSAGLR
jgi:recombination protein RecA